MEPAYSATAKDGFFSIETDYVSYRYLDFFNLGTAKFSVEDTLSLCPGSFEETFQFTRGSSF